jgi:dTDP-4-dehydrorhamnose reductase
VRILLTGGTGLLALNWACALRDRHEIVLATHRRKVELAGTRALPLPLDDADALAGALERLAPDVVVHTASLTSVDACEADPALARHVNAELAGNVARAVARSGSRLIHISTDHLFGGTRALYTETEAPEPLNEYARSKLLAEVRVTRACPGALVVRTNFFGWGHRYRRSFSDWIYYALAEGRRLTMFDDVFVTPILADDLAANAQRLLELGASGVYNVVGDQRISKYAFAVALAEAFELPKSLVERGKIADSKLPARRPPDMSLDNRKAREHLGAPLGTLADFLPALKAQDDTGRRRELLAAIQE